MKDTLGLIPQVFYDLIGRIIPGATTLALGFMLLSPEATLRTTASLSNTPSAVAVTFLLGAMTVYVFGFILGAIGSVVEDGLRQPAFDDIRKTKPGAVLEEADIPYIYDFILLHSPATGARLAKLRAEGHMCGGLVVSLGVLSALYVGKYWNQVDMSRISVFIALITSGLAAFNFQRHLRTRGWRLQINSWLELGPQPASVVASSVTSESSTQLTIRDKPAADPSALPTEA